jgi:ADP-ribose pyrophosphatase YjhB (NUDIX family)
LAARLGRLAAAVPSYLQIASWSVSKRAPLAVAQAVVLSESGVLLTVRGDLRGWELPGGHPRPGEPLSEALVREVFEETGLDVAVERKVGDYVRSGFRPHCASVFECRVLAGDLRPSLETPLVRWFDPDQLPDTLFPWYRAPLEDALRRPDEPLLRREHQGLGAIWAGLRIDLRMRWTNDRAG